MCVHGPRCVSRQQNMLQAGVNINTEVWPPASLSLKISDTHMACVHSIAHVMACVVHATFQPSSSYAVLLPSRAIVYTHNTYPVHKCVCVCVC